MIPVLDSVPVADDDHVIFLRTGIGLDPFLGGSDKRMIEHESFFRRGSLKSLEVFLLTQCVGAQIEGATELGNDACGPVHHHADRCDFNHAGRVAVGQAVLRGRPVQATEDEWRFLTLVERFDQMFDRIVVRRDDDVGFP